MNLIIRDLIEFSDDAFCFLSNNYKFPKQWEGKPNARFLINWKNMPVDYDFIFGNNETK